MPVYNLQQESVRVLNQALHDADASETAWDITETGGKHCLAVGVDASLEITINGHVGYYCAGMNKQASVVIQGNAGPGLAENIMSGIVRVTGNASQYAAATGQGGLVVIEGDASARCGISMKGVDIVVGGSIGHMGAFIGQSGTLVVCGDAGEALGDSIFEVDIFVRGKVKSLGADCVEREMGEDKQRQLQQLLSKAAIQAEAKDFSYYSSGRQLYNFKIDDAYLSR